MIGDDDANLAVQRLEFFFQIEIKTIALSRLFDSSSTSWQTIIEMDSLSLLASAGTGSIYLWAYTAVSIASFYLFFQLILKPYLESKEPFTDIPSLPNSHWLTGSAYQILRDPDFRKVQERTFNDYADAKGRTGFWVFTQRCVVLTDAEDVRTVLEQVTNKSAPVAAKYFSRRAFGPNTLPLMNGKHWLVHRAKINRSMHPSSITSMRESSAQVVQVAATTLKALVQGHAKSTSFVMDVEILGKCITVDDWGVYALLHQFRCCENFELVRFVQCFNIMMKDVVDRMQGNLFDVTSWLYFLPVAKNIRFRYANQNVRQLMKEFIEEHRAKACKEHDTAEEKKDDEATTKCRKILLDNLMDVYDEQKYDINTFVDVVSCTEPPNLSPRVEISHRVVRFSVSSCPDDNFTVCRLRWRKQNHCLRTLPNKHPS